jgi:undecaprenyl diphosphate synthase
MVVMTAATETAPLRHIIVVGGTPGQWAAMSDQQWVDRLAELGKVADHVGASWLTLRPYSNDGTLVDGTRVDNTRVDNTRVDNTRPDGAARTSDVGSCRVSAQPVADGRLRVADAAATLQHTGRPITEAALAAQLNLPALADPDLVVVLGPGNRLPGSLVWELAYAELVFIDTDWQHLGAAHLDEAITSYAHRHRRFGGID